MNELDKVLEKGRALIAFITAGDPDPAVSVKYALALQKGGADVLELGIPFSDPTAEGVQIQDANIRALKAGTNVEKTFEIVGQIRKNSDIPIVLRSYLNPVFRYGYKAFFSACARLGVCGLEVPDLPFEEKNEAADIAPVPFSDMSRWCGTRRGGQKYLRIKEAMNLSLIRRYLL